MKFYKNIGAQSSANVSNVNVQVDGNYNYKGGQAGVNLNEVNTKVPEMGYSYRDF